MRKRIPIKNHQQEIQLIAHRSMFGLAFICLLVILLLARLSYLQIYKNDIYTTLSTNNWLDLVPVEPSRGLIFDRNGILLAENVPVFSLDIIPNQISNLPKTLVELGDLVSLNDNDLTQFRRQLRQHRRFDEIPLKLRLTEDEVARFVENQHRFPGLIIKARLMRHYPYGESFSHVLGYVGRINAQELEEIDTANYSASHYIGKLGIEKFYEEELHGKVGYEEVENDASGKSVRTLKDIKGIPGKNLYLTIDINLQFIAEKALEGHRGAVVAIQPATGQVLAMVSQPAYDPNMFVVGISQKDYQALQSAEDRPLFNRALRGKYPIASTIKPYFALKGLDDGFITPEETVYDPGWFQLRNSEHVYHDWWRPGHGNVNLNRAIVSSCDIYFYELANKMGIHRMDDILTQFGFGSLTGIDLDDELTGIVASPEWKQKIKGVRWYPGDTIISAIGQGFMQATPLQFANGVAILANRGQRFMPYLLLGEHTPGGAYIPQQPLALEPVTLRNPGFWDVVINAMQQVVSSPQGSAFKFYGRNYNYTLAAKTGTGAIVKRRIADREDNPEAMPEKFRDHHVFVAFAPVDHPKIAVGIVSENSNAAIKAARAIFDYYLECADKIKNPAEASKLPAMCNDFVQQINQLGNQQNANREPQNETKKTSA